MTGPAIVPLPLPLDFGNYDKVMVVWVVRSLVLKPVYLRSVWSNYLLLIRWRTMVGLWMVKELVLRMEHLRTTGTLRYYSRHITNI